ncbi:hypothetical protein KFK09_007339 [Dendrobium nobile]|uniref:FCP1 homology domain-containing protein n=1 Tax=Dendrobium nobile TaxID=94219 RepID=A0A8T3BRT0_DENNO|nr:hypothetical protein KFK09_007339 [Dendrobium nobile]
MSELAATELCASGPGGARTLQVWRTLMSWFAFVFRIFWEIVKGTPSLAQVLSFLGVRHPLLSSSLAFKPLPADAPTDTPPPATAAQSAILGKLMDVEGEAKVSHVTVFERPGLREFLQQISEFADLVLFTAGLEGYARPLVDKIDVDNKFTHRLYRPATVSTEYREHVKDLLSISKDFCRIVLVDNNPFSFLLQPLNGIPCVPFSAGQPYDEQLLGVILPLLKRLSLQKDVRPVLHERFNMPEWFKQHGIPNVDIKE